MGLFLSMIVCKTSNRKEVINSLIEIMSKRAMSLKSKSEIDQINDEENEFEVTFVENGWVQIFTPPVPDEEMAKDLSKKLNTPVFLFHIHDGEFWMYHLFICGELKDKHNPIPNYWKRITEKEREEWRGNPKTLAAILKIPVESIEKYLVFWEEINDKNKKTSFKGEHSIKSEWAMVDFQRKLGIKYPDFENPINVKLTKLIFEGEEDKKKPKKWWERLTK